MKGPGPSKNGRGANTGQEDQVLRGYDHSHREPPDAFENKDIIPLPWAESFVGASGYAQVTYTYTQEDDGTGQNKQTITIISADVTGVGCWFN